MEHKDADQQAAVERIVSRVRKLIPPVAIAAVMIVLAAARAAASVLIPLVFALFLIAVFWPLQRRLQQRMPLSLATTLTTLLLLLILALFVGDALVERTFGGRPVVALCSRTEPISTIGASGRPPAT